MPKRLEIALQRRAQVLGLKGERRNAYVYGTMQKIKEREAAKREAPNG